MVTRQHDPPVAHAKTNAWNSTMIRPSLLFILGALFALCGCQSLPPLPPVTLADCLADLTEPMRLATGSASTMTLFSSYDRSGGNQDSSNFHGTHHDGSSILAKWKGPGCVRRMWFTGLDDDQELRFFFGGEKTPSLTCTYSDLKKGDQAPFLAPLCSYPSDAVVSYLPIPFSDGLIISAVPLKQDLFYYQINAETFPAGTPVRDLPRTLSPENLRQIKAIETAWNHPESSIKDARRFELMPEKTIPIFTADGPSIIEELTITPDWPEDLTVQQLNRLLRTTVLRIYWNDQNQPSVDVPLGDFFLNGRDCRQHDAFLFSNQDGSWSCRLPMPFKESARIELINQSQTPFSVSAAIRVKPLSVWNNNLHYLHATWNQATTPKAPLRILTAKGRGHLAGCYLTALATDRKWNILEGDERIFIDRKWRAAFHGTGLEDYFNGGWYYNQAFNDPFGGALEDGAIKTTQYRFHLPDPVSFKKSIKMDIEFGHANSSAGHMAATAFYYLEQPAPAAFHLPSAQKRAAEIDDPHRRAAAMCSLFEAERAGNLTHAIRLATDYAERNPATSGAELMQLRIMAYRGYTQGFAAVKNELQAFRDTSIQQATKKQADQLLGFHNSANKALLTTHINGAYELYLDGKIILCGDSLYEVESALVNLPKGRHVLAAKVEWTRPDNWITVNLRGHTGEWFTDTSWKNSQFQRDGWTEIDYNDSAWRPCRDRGFLPKMDWFDFDPNAFIFTQHHPLIGPSQNQDKPGKTSYFRKVFEVE
jgi:hypothetical protein